MSTLREETAKLLECLRVFCEHAEKLETRIKAKGDQTAISLFKSYKEDIAPNVAFLTLATKTLTLRAWKIDTLVLPETQKKGGGNGNTSP